MIDPKSLVSAVLTEAALKKPAVGSSVSFNHHEHGKVTGTFKGIGRMGGRSYHKIDVELPGKEGKEKKTMWVPHHDVSEEVEVLDELSVEKLIKYALAAHKQMKDDDTKTVNRDDGIIKASKKILAKSSGVREETLAELSRATLTSYLNKARRDRALKNIKGVIDGDQKAINKSATRSAGMSVANKKSLAKEETE